ncbi:hypothetical protein EYZ11_008213 [Aspergillus tanneri]|uniref:Protein kinase domain-containing protein n=1 Tax=Aspergillus tanneri TaxID=1220188 RepID=A0A4S3JB11_9EURO|nr:hypothetical protein EYZ11_008213 [Aspergillus tanneri]
MSRDHSDALDFDLSFLHIGKELKQSEASSIFEVEIHGSSYAMKVFHNNGDPGFTKKGRDLNRFRCELNAYRNLYSFGVCERGLVPYYYGYIDRLDPAKYQPHLNHFAGDTHFPNRRLQTAIYGLRQIHNALIHHHDIYPKNILIVQGHPERVVWIDFDVAVTFPSKEAMNCQAEKYCQHEIELFASFGQLLQEDQKQGLPPNTKYY